MIQSVQQIKFEILAYIKEFGADFSQWHIGVASDPKGKLVGEHGVDLEKDIWLYRQAVSFSACRTIGRYLTDGLGIDGEVPRTGSEDTDCVYLFRKSGRTTPGCDGEHCPLVP